MRKFILAVVCLLTFLGAKAQTYSSGHLHVTVTDSMWHDSAYCQTHCSTNYHITVDSSFIGDSVHIVDTFSASLIGSYYNTLGASPWVFDAALGTSANEDVGLTSTGVSSGYAYFYMPTRKVVSNEDTIHYITTIDSFYTHVCEYRHVSGNIFLDNNGNCIFDSTDVPFFYAPVRVVENLSSPVGSYTAWWLSAGGGNYDYLAQQSWMTSYAVTIPSYFSFIFPGSACFVDTYTFTTMPQSNVNFPLQCSSNIDVQCFVGSPGSARLHTPFYIQPYVSNIGCYEASGQLNLILDHRVTYDSALSTYAPDTVRGDTLIWNYYNLSNVSGGAYWNSFFSDLYLIPDSTLVVGDTLCFRVYTGVLPADINAANNDYSVCMPVVYSYDPNEKEVSPKGSGPEGFIGGDDTLTYTLHFQNTGSDIAYDIHVIDTLDSHINASSLRILGTSHNMTPQWLAPNIVEFDYNNIFLPDSFSNEPASHGSVRFSVALNHGLPVGTQIKNTGYIYFDANPAVVTNTTLNTIGAVSYVVPVTKRQDMKVYPNPATDNITVENLEGGTLSIVNVNGVVVLQQDIANNKTIIDVSRLANGIYFLKAVNKDSTATTKFIKY